MPVAPPVTTTSRPIAASLGLGLNNLYHLDLNTPAAGGGTVPLADADPVDAIAHAWQRERPGTPVESIGLVTRIWRLASLFADDRRRLLAAQGVDAALLDLLGTLRRAGPPYCLTTRDLSERTGVTPGAISQRLARAERDGYITRSPAGRPSRAVAVTLTPKGHQLVE